MTPTTAQMSRRSLLAAGLATGIRDGLSDGGREARMRPNIVWISCEDINPDLGSYRGVYPGAEYGVTPNLDRLAAEGARFDLAFAVSPVCAPSRSSIITGMYPTSIGTMHMRSRGVPWPSSAGVCSRPSSFRSAWGWRPHMASSVG